ncbi:hypothetical protein RG963_02675 [Methanosarcina sp. Z-7115]|uniref:Uncharacterized protein n=1 Tax=Methanosarcina baikalica TaxID=3073890 RepID=A0ABU2CYA1_9EURY|nr:hypothetical protein [Methanosarcina sp. Z-7115]MDR7664709.1 hypothetical protein [Methanosarcina sp. Z-7115]
MADGGSNFSGKDKRVWKGSSDTEQRHQFTNQKKEVPKNDKKSK